MDYAYTKIPERYIDKARSLEDVGSGDLAWNREDAKQLLTDLRDTTLKVLGGEVWYEKNGNLELTYDNWYCDRKSGESDKSFQERGIQKALDYIKKYKEPSGVKVYYAIGLSEL